MEFVVGDTGHVRVEDDIEYEKGAADSDEGEEELGDGNFPGEELGEGLRCSIEDDAEEGDE